MTPRPTPSSTRCTPTCAPGAWTTGSSWRCWTPRACTPRTSPRSCAPRAGCRGRTACTASSSTSTACRRPPCSRALARACAPSSTTSSLRWCCWKTACWTRWPACAWGRASCSSRASTPARSTPRSPSWPASGPSGRAAPTQLAATRAAVTPNVFAGATAGLLRFLDSVEVRLAELGPALPPHAVDIDYVEIFGRDRERAHAAKRRARWRPPRFG
jgi:hypothetical protein